MAQRYPYQHQGGSSFPQMSSNPRFPSGPMRQTTPRGGFASQANTGFQSSMNQPPFNGSQMFRPQLSTSEGFMGSVPPSTNSASQPSFPFHQHNVGGFNSYQRPNMNQSAVLNKGHHVGQDQGSYGSFATKPHVDKNIGPFTGQSFDSHNANYANEYSGTASTSSQNLPFQGARNMPTYDNQNLNSNSNWYNTPHNDGNMTTHSGRNMHSNSGQSKPWNDQSMTQQNDQREYPHTDEMWYNNQGMPQQSNQGGYSQNDQLWYNDQGMAQQSNQRKNPQGDQSLPPFGNKRMLPHTDPKVPQHGEQLRPLYGGNQEISSNFDQNIPTRFQGNIENRASLGGQNKPLHGGQSGGLWSQGSGQNMTAYKPQFGQKQKTATYQGAFNNGLKQQNKPTKNNLANRLGLNKNDGTSSVNRENIKKQIVQFLKLRQAKKIKKICFHKKFSPSTGKIHYNDTEEFVLLFSDVIKCEGRFIVLRPEFLRQQKVGQKVQNKIGQQKEKTGNLPKTCTSNIPKHVNKLDAVLLNSAIGDEKPSKLKKKNLQSNKNVKGSVLNRRSNLERDLMKILSTCPNWKMMKTYNFWKLIGYLRGVESNEFELEVKTMNDVFKLFRSYITTDNSARQISMGTIFVKLKSNIAGTIELDTYHPQDQLFKYRLISVLKQFPLGRCKFHKFHTTYYELYGRFPYMPGVCRQILEEHFYKEIQFGEYDNVYLAEDFLENIPDTTELLNARSPDAKISLDPNSTDDNETSELLADNGVNVKAIEIDTIKVLSVLKNRKITKGRFFFQFRKYTENCSRTNFSTLKYGLDLEVTNLDVLYEYMTEVITMTNEGNECYIQLKNSEYVELMIEKLFRSNLLEVLNYLGGKYRLHDFFATYICFFGKLPYKNKDCLLLMMNKFQDVISVSEEFPSEKRGEHEPKVDRFISLIYKDDKSRIWTPFGNQEFQSINNHLETENRNEISDVKEDSTQFYEESMVEDNYQDRNDETSYVKEDTGTTQFYEESMIKDSYQEVHPHHEEPVVSGQISASEYLKRRKTNSGRRHARRGAARLMKRRLKMIELGKQAVIDSSKSKSISKEDLKDNSIEHPTTNLSQRKAWWEETEQEEAEQKINIPIDNPRQQESRDNPRQQESRDNPRQQESSSREPLKDHSREYPRSISREFHQSSSQEQPRNISREHQRSRSREHPRSISREHSSKRSRSSTDSRQFIPKHNNRPDIKVHRDMSEVSEVKTYKTTEVTNHRRARNELSSNTGTKTVYDRSRLKQIRNSPLAKSRPPNMAKIPGADFDPKEGFVEDRRELYGSKKVDIGLNKKRLTLEQMRKEIEIERLETEKLRQATLNLVKKSGKAFAGKKRPLPANRIKRRAEDDPRSSEFHEPQNSRFEYQREEYDSYYEEPEMRDSERPEVYDTRSAEWESETGETFNRGNERERSYERGIERERSYERGKIRGRIFKRGGKRGRMYERGSERERPYERENEIEKSYERGNERERSYERGNERGRSYERGKIRGRIFKRGGKRGRMYERGSEREKPYERGNERERSYERGTDQSQTSRRMDNSEEIRDDQQVLLSGNYILQQGTMTYNEMGQAVIIPHSTVQTSPEFTPIFDEGRDVQYLDRY